MTETCSKRLHTIWRQSAILLVLLRFLLYRPNYWNKIFQLILRHYLQIWVGLSGKLPSYYYVILLLLFILLQLGFHPVAVASTVVYTAQWPTHKIME
jgi:hypothetical protein